MLKKIEQMKRDNEYTAEEPMEAKEIAYLEQIQTVEDLTNYDHNDGLLQALSYDAALAMGLSKREAMIIAGDIVEQPIAQEEKDALEKEYDRLARNYNASMSAIQDAEYHLVEEISSEGFASKGAYEAKAHYEDEAEKDLAELNLFKRNNKKFLAEIKAQRSADNTRSVWNQ